MFVFFIRKFLAGSAICRNNWQSIGVSLRNKYYNNRISNYYDSDYKIPI
jgi:hypothetical protein